MNVGDNLPGGHGGSIAKMQRIGPERYFSREHMAREERLWRSVWLCVGRDDASAADTVSWAGFRWTHRGRDPEPLADYLGEVQPLVEAYDLARWHTELAVTTELGCNWKASVDAHNESYHVHALHPEVLATVDDVNASVDHFGPHSRIRVPMGRPSPRLGRSPDEGARRAAQEARRRPEHAPLTDDQLTDNHQIYIFPNLQLNLFADHGLAFRHRPHATDPERCHFDMFVLTRRGHGGDPCLREVASDDAVFGPVTGADLAMLPRLQRGMRSPGFRGLVLGDREACIRRMHETIDGYLTET